MKDLNPLFGISNGGGSSCIEGWDGITDDVNPFALITHGGGSGG